MLPGGGKNKPLHHLILNLFEHEKVRRLMEENSDWLEVLDPDDPPLQAEGGDGGPPHSQTKAHTGRLKSQRITDIVEAGQDLRINK